MSLKQSDIGIPASENEIFRLSKFVHRTFNGSDIIYFMNGLRNIYSNYMNMEDVLLEGMESGGSLKDGLTHMRSVFFSLPHDSRNEKHFADVRRGAAGKRLNMFLQIIKVAC